MGRACQMLVLSVSLAACIPYFEMYRPLIDGHVVTAEGAPVDGVNVRACSESRWKGMDGCPRETIATTVDGGTFHFEPIREFELCCFGEAPMPRTTLTVLTSAGDPVETLIDWQANSSQQLVTLRLPADAGVP